MRLIVLNTFLCLAAAAQNTPSFQQDIEPLLTAKCAGCHNEKTRTSGLNVLSRQSLLAGGNRGPAIQSQHPEASLLLQAVRQSGDLKMPPGGKLSDAEIASLERWIAAGAKFPDASPAEAEQPKPPLKHWAFQPIQHPAPPPTRDSAWPKTEIDKFILARLEKEGVRPAEEAGSLTLLRRVYLDLIGLPPTPAQVADYLADKRPDRYEKLVDQLLASPHYGERWGRHWLDQARYADSDGGSRDEPREIWKYRDWVIQALNRDLPFDQFVVEQLAGDLFPYATPDQQIATGFNRNSPLQIEAGTDRELYRVEAVADRVDATGTVFLGLSVGCARCHDHKYDPISQREYYQFFAFFNNVDEYGPELPPYSSTSDIQVTHAPLVPIGPKDQVEKWQAIRAQLLALYRERFEYGGGEQLNNKNEGYKIRSAAIDYLKKQLPPLPVSMVMNERPQPRETHVLLGGDYMRKGARVEPGVLSVLNPPPPHAEKRPLNRLDLARWMVDPKNPLLARVAVNRIWQQYFGLGLVETENDFGAKGSLPSHPQLLDWLASEFIRQGWSQKAIHRLIVTSAVYRQSSHARPEVASRDPLNRLFARQARLRLDAEVVRDSGLVVSGLLAEQIGGPSVYPPQPEGVMETGQVKQPWKTSQGADRYRRGMYTFHYRITPNPAMKVLDAANGLAACTRRGRTDTPLQALDLLNDPNFYEMAQAFARRVVGRPAPERIDYAFQSAMVRVPMKAERQRIERLLATEKDSFLTNPAEAAGATPEVAAWTTVCRVLLNTDEFITRE